MRVAVAMSGGIDSSVATLILKEKDYDVIGLTMKLWDDGSRCCSLEDVYIAKRVAAELNIPHYTIDLRDAFKQEVVDYFVNEYLCGRTPNPCVVCNQKIKFGALLNKAKTLSAQYIATGHYARIEKRVVGTNLIRVYLKRGKDKEKDQSYFLSMLSQESLTSVIFPLGEYTKEKVRKLGTRLGIDKKESQEVCFIPNANYVEFIKKFVGTNSICAGVVADKKGNVIGHHKGIVNYTIGQRTGIGLPASNPFSKPLYVIEINPDKNTVIVGEEEDLLCKSLIVERLNWIVPPPIVGTNSTYRGSRVFKGEGVSPLPLIVDVQIRYRSLPAKASLIPMGDEVLVEFLTPHKAITPGQLAVFYKGDTVIGSGWIKKNSRGRGSKF